VILGSTAFTRKPISAHSEEDLRHADDDGLGLRAAAGTIILASPEFQRLLRGNGARVVTEPTVGDSMAASSVLSDMITSPAAQ